jgi:hypothetical protein
MTDIRSATRLVMATRLIGDVVKDETDAAKVLSRELMQQTGIERVRVNDEAGNSLGTVSLTVGRVSARVTDEAAFTAWVQRNHPDETVTVVRDSFRKKVLDSATGKAEHGDPTAVGPDGEVLPGVEVVHGLPYIMVRPTVEARDRMRTMLANSGLLALASGATPAEEVPGDAA